MKNKISNRTLKFKNFPIKNYVTTEFLQIYSKQVAITSLNEDNISILSLTITNCNITNFSPFEILLEKLEKLILEKNNLNTKIISSIKSKNLVFLNLSNNNFENFPILDCPKVRFLNFSKNCLKKIPSEFLKKSVFLQNLDLSFNKINFTNEEFSVILKIFAKLDIRNLSLYQNNFITKFPEYQKNFIQILKNIEFFNKIKINKNNFLSNISLSVIKTNSQLASKNDLILQKELNLASLEYPINFDILIEFINKCLQDHNKIGLYSQKLIELIDILVEKYKLHENIFIQEQNDSIIVSKIEEFNDKILCLLEIQPSFGIIAVKIWIRICILKLFQDSEIKFLENLLNFNNNNVLYLTTIKEGLSKNIEFLINKDIFVIDYKKLAIINKLFDKKIKIKDNGLFLKIEDIIFHWIEQIYKLDFCVKLEQSDFEVIFDFINIFMKFLKNSIEFCNSLLNLIHKYFDLKNLDNKIFDNYESFFLICKILKIFCYVIKFQNSEYIEKIKKNVIFFKTILVIINELTVEIKNYFLDDLKKGEILPILAVKMELYNNLLFLLMTLLKFQKNNDFISINSKKFKKHTENKQSIFLSILSLFTIKEKNITLRKILLNFIYENLVNKNIIYEDDHLDYIDFLTDKLDFLEKDMESILNLDIQNLTSDELEYCIIFNKCVLFYLNDDDSDYEDISQIIKNNLKEKKIDKILFKMLDLGQNELILTVFDLLNLLVIDFFEYQNFSKILNIFEIIENSNFENKEKVLAKILILLSKLLYNKSFIAKFVDEDRKRIIFLFIEKYLLNLKNVKISQNKKNILSSAYIYYFKNLGNFVIFSENEKKKIEKIIKESLILDLKNNNVQLQIEKTFLKNSLKTQINFLIFLEPNCIQFIRILDLVEKLLLGKKKKNF